MQFKTPPKNCNGCAVVRALPDAAELVYHTFCLSALCIIYAFLVHLSLLSQMDLDQLLAQTNKCAIVVLLPRTLS